MNQFLLNVLAVSLGGALGSVARYLATIGTQTWLPDWRFPIATTTVNLVGCFLIGCIAEWCGARGVDHPEWRLFLMTGVLGGFTTFSAFGLETVMLLRNGEFALGCAVIAIQVVAGCGAVVLGLSAARAVG